MVTFHLNDTDTSEPEVNISSLTIITPDRPDMVIPVPFVPNSKGYAFTLKDGSRYRLKFTFNVSNNIVSGLRYTNTVWKTGVKGKFRFPSLVFTFLSLVSVFSLTYSSYYQIPMQ